ncbi:MAG: DMT family transporter [Bacilli bacterium]|nr:DMT family transporter [Bacilli bacterium]
MKEESAKRVWSHIGMVLCVLLWGLAPLAGKYLFDEGAYSPALLIALRGAVSVLLMGLFLLFTGRFRKLNKSYWICLPAGLILGSAYLFQFIGLESTALSKNTFLESFSVIAVPLSIWILTRKRPGIASAFASILCLAGAFVLCGNGMDFSALFTTPTLGEAFSAIGGLLFGVNIAFTKVFVKDKDPFLYVFIQLLVMTVISFAYALPFEKGLAYSFEFRHILVLLFLAVICTVGCWILRTASIKRVSAITCAVLNPMSAVIATILSISLSFEPFSWNVIVGGAIILLAVFLSGIYDALEEKRHVHKRETPSLEMESSQDSRASASTDSPD